MKTQNLRMHTMATTLPNSLLSALLRATRSITPKSHTSKFKKLRKPAVKLKMKETTSSLRVMNASSWLMMMSKWPKRVMRTIADSL